MFHPENYNQKQTPAEKVQNKNNEQKHQKTNKIKTNPLSWSQDDHSLPKSSPLPKALAQLQISDEKNTKNVDQSLPFLCKNQVQQISPELYCNGEPDCDDKSDEENCRPNSRNSKPVQNLATLNKLKNKSRGQCLPGEFRCDSGMCIDKNHYCDGDYSALKIVVRRRNLVVFEVFGVKFSAEKSIFQNRPI